jgi:hypothetical protein
MYRVLNKDQQCYLLEESTKPLFTVGTAQSTKALEVGAIAFFLILGVLSVIADAYYIAILFFLISLSFTLVYFRLERIDFYEDALRIYRRRRLLGEIHYFRIESAHMSKGTFTLPPRISLKVKEQKETLSWVGNPKSKELSMDLYSWLKKKMIES